MKLFLFVGALFAPLAMGQTYNTESVHLQGPEIDYSGYGYEIDSQGEWLAVGSIIEEVDGIHQGSVSMYRWGEHGWEYFQKILSPEPGHGWQFSDSIDLENNRLIVGSPGWGVGDVATTWNHPFFKSGKAFLFQFNGTSWVHELTLRPTIPDVNHGFNKAGFGEEVALSHNRIAVKSWVYAVDFPATAGGVINTYELVGGSWVADDPIIAPYVFTDGGGFSSFGLGLDIDDDRIAVGAPGTTGKVFTYVRSPSGWQMESILRCPWPGNGGVDWYFGLTVALDGDQLAVGMPGWNCFNGPCPSGVVVFERLGGGWIEKQVLTDPEVNVIKGLGRSLRLEGDYLVAGSHGTWGNGPGSQVRLYEKDPTLGFQLKQRYVHATTPLGGINSVLGHTAAANFERGVIVAGDPSFAWTAPTTWGYAQGVVLQFDMDLGTDLSCTGTANSSGEVSHLAVIGSTELAEDRLNLHASHLPPGEFSLFLYGQVGATPIPIQSGGSLCITGGVNRMMPPGPAGEFGQRFLNVDLSVPREAANLMPGTTWAFQVWHRDLVGGSSVTGTTNAVEVLIN